MHVFGEHAHAQAKTSLMIRAGRRRTVKFFYFLAVSFDHIAGSLVVAGKHAADHHKVRACKVGVDKCAATRSPTALRALELRSVSIELKNETSVAVSVETEMREAPPAKALTMSPGTAQPPSEIIRPPRPCAASAHSMTVGSNHS